MNNTGLFLVFLLSAVGLCIADGTNDTATFNQAVLHPTEYSLTIGICVLFACVFIIALVIVVCVPLCIKEHDRRLWVLWAPLLLIWIGTMLLAAVYGTLKLRYHTTCTIKDVAPYQTSIHKYRFFVTMNYKVGDKEYDSIAKSTPFYLPPPDNYEDLIGQHTSCWYEREDNAKIHLHDSDQSRICWAYVGTTQLILLVIFIMIVVRYYARKYTIPATATHLPNGNSA